MTKTGRITGGGSGSWRKDPTTPHHHHTLKDTGTSSWRKDAPSSAGGGRGRDNGSRKDQYGGGGGRKDSGSAWRKRSPLSSSQEELDDIGSSRQYRSNEPSTDNRRAYSPVAETLFRKDLISAMKLPDNEPLEPEDYWTVQDTWKQEWEKGVQVPVKPDGLPEPTVMLVANPPTRERFALPRKLICMNASGSYTAETHQVTPMLLRAEQVCAYDLDDVDQRWLINVNGERALMGLSSVTENEMERVMEELERQCRDKINTSLRSSEDTEIQQDESIICDVCRSPDSEESNEMVFCDQCNICVHQACYGILDIPAGSWLCRTCSLGIKPPCQLCPNKGGAMKSTRSGQKWAHVSCALWIPEVSIGNVERMEPITKISSIPTSRWSLVCVLCKEKTGSCIQCSVKTCKTAYHVTCAFRHKLEMRAIIDDENTEDGVKLRSYCQKHSLPTKKSDDSDSDSGSKPKLSPEDRRKKMATFEREFYKLVDVSSAASKVDTSQEIVEFIYRYWILKRKASGNKPLLTPREEEEKSGVTPQGEDTEKDKKMLVNIRQDLERVRNLAYMVSRREKMSRSFVKLREQIFERQLALLADEEPGNQMSLAEMSAVLEANHGPTVYDKIFSSADSEQHTYDDFELIISRIAGEIKEGSSQIRKDNPERKTSIDTKPTPYMRIFSDTSQSESDDSFHYSRFKSQQGPGGRQNLSKKSHSNKDIKKKSSPLDKKSGKHKSNKTVHSDSSLNSSEVERQFNRLSPRKDQSKKFSTHIYSDTDSDTDRRKSKASSSSKTKSSKVKSEHNKKTDSSFDWRDSEDTQASTDRPNFFRTKAAMKDFSLSEMTRAKETAAGTAQSPAAASTPTSSRGRKSRQQAKQQLLPISRDSSISDMEAEDSKPPLMQLVPERSAARKANQKLNKKVEAGAAATNSASDTKKRGKAAHSKTSTLFDDSDDSESGTPAALMTESSLRKSPRAKHGGAATTNYATSDASDVDTKFPLVMKNNKDEPKSKLNQKQPAKTKSSVFSDSDDDSKSIFSLPSSNKKAATPRQSSSSSNKTKKQQLSQNDFSTPDEEFNSLFPTNNSETDEEFHNKKRVFDDFENPETFTFVPQRRAAKKASEQLRETDLWKKSQQVAYQAIIDKQKEDKAAQLAADPLKKLSRGRPGKQSKKKVASAENLSDTDNDVFRRTRSSSSSSSSSTAEDSDSGKSPRGARGAKSPKGKSGKTQSPRTPKPALAKKARNKKSPRRPEGSISSSKALQYLSQRESQISNILGNYDKDKASGGEGTDKTGKVPPDKKLKTSEGRPEGVQSPPSSTKNSSDSESDSSSDNSDAKIKNSIAAYANQEAAATGMPEQQPAAATTPSSRDATFPSHEIGGGGGTPLSSGGKADDQPSRSRRGNISDSSLERSRRMSGDDFGASPPHLFTAPTGTGGGSSYRDRKSSVGGQLSDRSPSKTPTAESQQFKQSPSSAVAAHFGRSPVPVAARSARESARSRNDSGSQKSIFSPERSSPRVPATGQSPAGQTTPSGTGSFRGAREHESLAIGGGGGLSAASQKENEVPGHQQQQGQGQWKSPRGSGKTEPIAGPGSAAAQTPTNISSTKSPRLSGSRERLFSPTKSSPIKSPALNRSSDHIKSSPLLKSPLQIHSQPSPGSKSSIVEPLLEKERKYSVESKDSDVDSAKSSLPDTNGLLQDLHKDDSTDTLEFQDKLSDASTKTEHQQASANHAKTDEGYISAEKSIVQTSPVFDSALIHNDRLATSKTKDVTGGGVSQTNLENIVSNLEKSIINNNEQRSDQFDYNALQQDKGLVGDKDSFDLGGHGSTGALKQDKQLPLDSKNKFGMKTDPIVQEDLIPGSGMNHQQSQAELERQAILEKQKIMEELQNFYPQSQQSMQQKPHVSSTRQHNQDLQQQGPAAVAADLQQLIQQQQQHHKSAVDPSQQMQQAQQQQSAAELHHLMQQQQLLDSSRSSSWSAQFNHMDQLQQQQYQQLQQQQGKGKELDLKNMKQTDLQAQLYNEAFYQQLNKQQTTNMLYAQQQARYIKGLSSLNYIEWMQNASSQQYQYLQASGLLKKEDLLKAYNQEAMNAGYYNNQSFGKLAEKMVREQQAKDKTKQPSGGQPGVPSGYPGQAKPSADHQKAYLEQFNQQQQISRSFLEQQAQAARGQDTKRMQHNQQQPTQHQSTAEDMYRMGAAAGQYGTSSSSSAATTHLKQQQTTPTGTSPDKLKRQSTEEYSHSSDLRAQRPFEHRQHQKQQPEAVGSNSNLQQQQSSYDQHHSVDQQQGLNRDYSMLQQQQSMYPDNNKDNHMQHHQANQQQSYSCQKQNKANRMSEDDRRTSPHHKPRPISPRMEKQQQNLTSCRMDQQALDRQQQGYSQEGVYGVPSATPAEKLPGYTPSIQHSREQKLQRQSLEGPGHHQPQQQFVQPAAGEHSSHQHSSSSNNINNLPPPQPNTQADKKGRDTPASVAGSDGSHNSTSIGTIPTELLEFVHATSNLEVFKPQDTSKVSSGGSQPEVKVSTSSNNNSDSSPAKQPPGSQHSQQASPPKSAPVIPERDKSALEELVKHIDASPSPRAHSEHQTTPRSDAKQLEQSSTDHFSSAASPLHPPPLSASSPQHPGEGDKLNEGENTSGGPKTCQLLFSTIPGLMGTGSQHSDRDNSEAEKSDYDDTMGGVDYFDDFEDNLPLTDRKRSHHDTSKQSVDISSWKTDNSSKTKTAAETKPKEPIKKANKVPCYKTEEKKVVAKPAAKVEEPPQPETLTKRGTKIPCYKEKDPDFELDKAKKIPVAPKGKGVKGGKAGVGGKLFGRKSTLKYDPKAIEKVHKNLAGTDFDFEDEFDDEPSMSMKEDVPGSLKDFRQLAKVKKTESSDFDEELSSVAQMPPVPTQDDDDTPAPTNFDFDDDKPLASLKAARPLANRNRKPRAAATAKPIPKDDDSDFEVEPKKVAPLKIKAIPKPDPPLKVPKIKIKFGGDSSNTTTGSIPDESTTTTNSSRKSSITSLDDSKLTIAATIDETEDKVPQKKIPKLKILLPPRPKESSSDKPKDVGSKKIDDFEDDIEPPPPLTIKRTPKSSPKKPTPRPYDDPDFDDDPPPPKQDFSLESLKSDLVKSSPRALAKTRSPAANKPSPPSVVAAAAVESNSVATVADKKPLDASPPDNTKTPKGNLDSITNKVVTTKQQTSVDKDSELNAIFGGPCEPLTMNMGSASEMIAAAADKDVDDGPSELDLLAMELKKFEKGKADEKSAAQDEDSNSIKEVIDKKEEKVEDDHQNNIMMKKYKMKSNAADFSRNTTSPGPQTTPVKLLMSSAAASSDKGHHRMRKKELLNSYIHGLEPPVQQPPIISQVMTNGPVSSNHPAPAHVPPKEPIRMNIIKMPKAVASITSVPTRADYQPQLEANMERKRKREGKEDPKSKGQKKGKGKLKEEEPYRPKLKKTQEAAVAEASEQKERRTRGMPPKKCLQESPEREDPRDSYKNSHLKYGEEMLKQFDQEERFGKKKDRKRKAKDDENHAASIKTPRIVIKFSKQKDPTPQRPAAAPSHDASIPGGGQGGPPDHTNPGSPFNLNKIKIKELKAKEAQC